MTIWCRKLKPKLLKMIETANHDIKEWRETTEQEVEDRLEDLKLEETELLEHVWKNYVCLNPSIVNLWKQ